MIKKLRVLLIVAVFMAAFSGAASALETTVMKRVDVNVDGKVTSLNTTKGTVAEVLESAGVTLAKDDMVTPAFTEEIKDNSTIYVYKTFMVTVNVDGSPRHLKVGKGTISAAKEKVEESIKETTTLIGAKETDPLVPDMTIELATSYTEKYEAEKEIPFEVSYVENAEVLEGTETVLTEGVNGKAITVYEKAYEGGKLVSTKELETKVAIAPVSKVIEKGTKSKLPVVPVKKETHVAKTVVPDKLTYSKVLTLEATAYTSDRGDAGTHTATGERARVGLVATDPKIIPLGTLLYVENYGVCRAADTGGAIKGKAIDLFFDTYEECINFGRRNVTVYVLEDYGDLLALEEALGKRLPEAEELFAS